MFACHFHRPDMSKKKEWKEKRANLQKRSVVPEEGSSWWYGSILSVSCPGTLKERDSRWDRMTAQSMGWGHTPEISMNGRKTWLVIGTFVGSLTGNLPFLPNCIKTWNRPSEMGFHPCATLKNKRHCLLLGKGFSPGMINPVYKGIFPSALFQEFWIQTFLFCHMDIKKKKAFIVSVALGNHFKSVGKQLPRKCEPGIRLSRENETGPWWCLKPALSTYMT